MYSFLREWWWPWKGPTHARRFDKFVLIILNYGCARNIVLRCAYKLFVQIINFHGLLRINALRCPILAHADHWCTYCSFVIWYLWWKEANGFKTATREQTLPQLFVTGERAEQAFLYDPDQYLEWDDKYRIFAKVMFLFKLQHHQVWFTTLTYSMQMEMLLVHYIFTLQTSHQLYIFYCKWLFMWKAFCNIADFNILILCSVFYKHDKVLSALTEVGETKSQKRFAPIVEALSNEDNPQLMVNMIQLLSSHFSYRSSCCD